MENIIAVVQNKGGVGKTTISFLTATYLSVVRGKRVLLIDIDGQCSLSNRYLAMEEDPDKEEDMDTSWRPPIHPDYDPNDPDFEDWNGRCAFVDIYFGGEIVPYPTSIEHLSILPGSSKLISKVNERRVDNDLIEKIKTFPAQFVNLPGVQEAYDYIIFDCPPAKNNLTIGAIKAATDIIIPIIPDKMSTEGLYAMYSLIQHQSELMDKKVNIAGIVPNMVDNRTQYMSSIVEEMRKSPTLGNLVTQNTLPLRSKIREAAEKDPSLTSPFDLPDSNEVKKLCMSLMQELEEKLS